MPSAKPTLKKNQWVDFNNSPLQQLTSSFLTEANIQLYVKRDDLLHPEFGGNKWRKLKYNLIHAKENNFDTLLTFGGAWSNHIYATAAAGKHFGLNTIGVIRGEKSQTPSETLQFAEKCGMQLHYISRSDYRKKNQTDFLKALSIEFNNPYIIPEGGSNPLGVRGCEEIVDEINLDAKEPFDIICCASGTGATLAGIVKKLNEPQLAIGFSALKNGDFLADCVNDFVPEEKEKNQTTKLLNNNWKIETAFHFGGYAKTTPDLIKFILSFQKQYDIPLDAVYTGKMFYGLFTLIKRNHFARGSKIIAIHSGGLQGNKGFNLTL